MTQFNESPPFMVRMIAHGLVDVIKFHRTYNSQINTLSTRCEYIVYTLYIIVGAIVLYFSINFI